MYRKFGLKTGDAMIAAFCQQEGIDVFISENRHFLRELPQRSFDIYNSQKFQTGNRLVRLKPKAVSEICTPIELLTEKNQDV